MDDEGLVKLVTAKLTTLALRVFHTTKRCCTSPPPKRPPSFLCLSPPTAPTLFIDSATSYTRHYAYTSLSNSAVLDHSRNSRLALAMPRLKRSAAEAQLDVSTEPQMSPEAAQTLKDLRDMWEFASLMQYIFLFGNVVKIDEDFDIEV